MILIPTLLYSQDTLQIGVYWQPSIDPINFYSLELLSLPDSSILDSDTTTALSDSLIFTLNDGDTLDLVVRINSTDDNKTGPWGYSDIIQYPQPECEAIDPARCWYVDADVVAGGSGTIEDPMRTPQTAALQAGPGDFIYVAGTFTRDHKMTTGNLDSCEIPEARGCTIMGGRHADGAEGEPITFTGWPGRTHVFLGALAERENVIVGIGGNWWVVDGLNIEGGYLIVAWRFVGGVGNVVLQNNEVSKATSPPGNTGLIRVHEGDPNPHNITIIDNYAHDLFACEPEGTTGPCLEGTTQEDVWSDPLDREHHACLQVQDASGPIFMYNNLTERCSAVLYLKRGGGSYDITGNTFRQSFWMGVCRHDDGVIEDNVIEEVGTLVREGQECITKP